MSLILDALNRSRNDSDPVPGIGTRHDAVVEQKEAGWRSYLPWSGLLVALLIIAFLLIEREDSATSQVATLSREPAAPVPAADTQPAPAPPAPAQPATPSGPAAGLSGTGADDITGSASAKSVQAPAAVGEIGAAAAEVDPEVARLYQQPAPQAVEPTQPAAAQPATESVEEKRTALAPTAEEERIDIEQLVRQAEEDMQNARLAEHSAPFISELSQQTKNDIPTVYYQRHDYSGVNGQSRVVLNGETVGKGGSPAPGMKVVEILPDSVVLRYRGTEFRLRALNSWVNL